MHGTIKPLGLREMSATYDAAMSQEGDVSPRSPISFSKDGTNWYLRFVGPKGRKHFSTWLQFIQTDPACRKALALDTHP